MTETLKTKVLAKCEAPRLKDRYEHFTETGAAIFRNMDAFCIKNPRRSIHVWVDSRLDENDEGWALAAQILGIEEKPKRDELVEEMCLHKGKCDNMIDLNAYAMGLVEMFDRIGLEEKPRPSNDLLWDAFGKGVGWSNYFADARSKMFKEWLSTLPPDALEGDKEIMRAKIRTIAKGIALASDDMHLDSELLDCVKRLTGMGVERGD